MSLQPAKFTARAGQIQANTQVSSINNEAIPMKDVGPIDIIAIKRDSKMLIVVECKRSSFSRNPKDLKTEAHKYFGKQNEIGHVERLKNKTDWIRSKRKGLAVQYELNDMSAWKIEAVLINSEYVWAIDAKKPEGLSAFTYREIESKLRDATASA